LWLVSDERDFFRAGIQILIRSRHVLSWRIDDRLVTCWNYGAIGVIHAN
jgi:hypothetical protein